MSQFAAKKDHPGARDLLDFAAPRRVDPPSRSQVTSSGTCTVTSLRLRFVTSGGILSRVQSSPRSFAPARRPHRHRVRGAPRGSAPPRSPRRAAWTAGCAETKDLYADPAASPSPRWAVLTPKLPALKEKSKGKTLGPYTLHSGERRRPSPNTAVLADSVRPERGGRPDAERQAPPPTARPLLARVALHRRVPALLQRLCNCAR